jgi:hypothetical protein
MRKVRRAASESKDDVTPAVVIGEDEEVIELTEEEREAVPTRSDDRAG